MDIDQAAFNQIATTLARHFDFLYYIDINTGNYCEVIPSKLGTDTRMPKPGDDFFSMVKEHAHKFVHPNDLNFILQVNEKANVLKNLAQNDSYAVNARLLMDGRCIHIRQIYIMCEDREHIISCLENIEEEFLEKEEQKKNLKSAERMARRDELTGIKNKNAFNEYIRSTDDRIQAGNDDIQFAVVMCDVNNLKLINDTRGHSFGDEVILRTSRMICNVFRHSPVFRIGGDEFAVILTHNDYKHRDHLLETLKNRCESNRRTSSGPSVACGMAVYDPDIDGSFVSVFKRADSLMYENKSEMKSRKVMDEIKSTGEIKVEIPDERKQVLDKLFGALYTVAGEGYVYLNDLRYDYSRWSLSLVDDFNIPSEYMYHAGRIWQDYIHPDDIQAYKKAVDEVIFENGEFRPMTYRARKADGTYVILGTRGFILNDSSGDPEYFGGIIIPQ